MGLFNKKKALPELPRPDVQASGSSNSESLRLPEFPQNDFPSYEALSSDLGSIKKAVKSSLPSFSNYEEPRQEPKAQLGEKTLFIKIDDYEAGISAIERLKEKLKDIDNVLNSIEKLKRQEDTELDSWHKDIESLKQKLMTVENRLFHL